MRPPPPPLTLQPLPLRRAKFPHMVPKPLWLLAELTYRCPLQCPYCSNPLDFAGARFKRELATEEWCRVFREARALGVLQLGLSGGEPLLRPDRKSTRLNSSHITISYAVFCLKKKKKKKKKTKNKQITNVL